MIKEFKAFISRGNVMDMAIGVIIGGAFQKIVTSLVNDIIMPALSFVTGKVNIADLGFTYNEITIKYGSFLSAVLDFLIIAFSIFMAITVITNINKKFNEGVTKVTRGKFKKKEEVKPEPTTKQCPFCLSEINIKATKCPHCTSSLEK
ncbi:MAG: large conductance mechanosensitive channel protein MscL [Clostridiales bacterium]|nr:large conductance mechanosensitive channel protein MscL [Clostridiales bacterium]